MQPFQRSTLHVQPDANRGPVPDTRVEYSFGGISEIKCRCCGSDRGYFWLRIVHSGTDIFRAFRLSTN